MPRSEQTDEYREWLGLDKDEVPNAGSFNIDEVNADLKQV